MNRQVLVRTMLASLLGVGLAACAVEGDDNGGDEGTVEGRGGNGNGAPSGAHYTLNIIGMERGKTADMGGDNGRRIFVALSGNTKIQLREGPFGVLDANGTDGTAAFQLPSPDPDGDGVTEYSVFARALGKPGGSAVVTTCATDPISGDEFCSLLSAVLMRNRGGNKFTNVSRDLLFVVADVDGDGDAERVALFGDELEDYFWDYDNHGLRVAQLRFYDTPTAF